MNITNNQIRAILNLNNWTPPIILTIAKRISKKINNNKIDSWSDKPVSYKSIHKIFKNKVVLNGPFKDMAYPNFISNGSSLYPKLLGSYELEIQDIVSDLIFKKFTKIIDIGSAEGYYAIGFALKSNESKIIAFDSNNEALENCKKMAKINKVLDKCEFKPFCSKSFLLNENLDNSLIISDCEGYEKELFLDKAIVYKLKNTTLLIETHDHVDINLSNNLKKFYNISHKITSIFSIDDIEKIKKYNYHIISDLDIKSKSVILSEGRSYIQEWLLMEPI